MEPGRYENTREDPAERMWTGFRLYPDGQVEFYSVGGYITRWSINGEDGPDWVRLMQRRLAEGTLVRLS